MRFFHQEPQLGSQYNIIQCIQSQVIEHKCNAHRIRRSIADFGNITALSCFKIAIRISNDYDPNLVMWLVLRKEIQMTYDVKPKTQKRKYRRPMNNYWVADAG